MEDGCDVKAQNRNLTPQVVDQFVAGKALECLWTQRNLQRRSLTFKTYEPINEALQVLSRSAEMPLSIADEVSQNLSGPMPIFQCTKYLRQLANAASRTDLNTVPQAHRARTINCCHVDPQSRNSLGCSDAKRVHGMPGRSSVSSHRGP